MIAIFDYYIEITKPGSLPSGLTMESVLTDLHGYVIVLFKRPENPRVLNLGMNGLPHKARNEMALARSGAPSQVMAY